MKARCKIEGCNDLSVCRGMCNKHYLRWRKYGDPLHVADKASPGTCKVDGCNGRHAAKGYCNKHYHRYLRYGDPLKSRPYRGKGKGTYTYDDEFLLELYSHPEETQLQFYERTGMRHNTVCYRFKTFTNYKRLGREYAAAKSYRDNQPMVGIG